jgi:PhoPQ-activated pathogenicity-related protein
MTIHRSVLRAVLLLSVFGLVIVVGARPAVGTALDDYVAAPDPSYSYNLVRTITGSGYTGYILNMISQTWRTSAEVDRPVWQHWLTIVKPNGMYFNKALLIIEGGSNGGSPPTSTNSLEIIAMWTGTVVAYLQMVPNQPLKFADEADPRYITGGRSEDAMIAYTWDKFLRTGDPTWPARLPMTKAAVRAMDTVQSFCASPQGGGINIDQFAVLGGSKRGWTTWTTAAVDSRVMAIIPVVIDVLNVERSMRHHYAAYGFWSSAVQDYVDMGIMSWFGTPQMAALMEIEDPYTYRNRYTMPKFIVNATGDQFFLPDSSQFYWDDLPGEKLLRYVPNADHGLSGGYAAAFTAMFYYIDILNETPRHHHSWTMEPDGSIRVQTVETPASVTLYQATNLTARDFRKETIGAAWTASPLTDQGGGVYVAQVPAPPTGWTAFLVELTYDSGLSFFPYVYTTQVSVVPKASTLNVDVVNPTWGRVVELDPNFDRLYRPDARVTLTAQPVEGKQFREWQIDDPNYPDDANHAAFDANTTITVAMGGDRHVTASFKCGSHPVQVVPVLVVGLAVFALLSRRMRRR